MPRPESKWVFWLACFLITSAVGTIGAITKYQQTKIDGNGDNLTKHSHPSTAAQLRHLHEEVQSNGIKIDNAIGRQNKISTGQAVQTEILKRIEITVKEIKEK